MFKNRGPGAKNQKSILNISKLEYYKVFWIKIQKLKIFRKKPKNRGLGAEKQKSILNKSKLEYYKAYWIKIQKLKFFR